MEKEIEELKKRIAELEKRPVIYPTYPPIQYQPPQYQHFHYHNGMPCYNNPCFWCGNNTMLAGK